MPSSRNRVGIERKILSTILWVCTLPIAVIIVMGYIVARGGQSTAVQQALLSAAQKTAEGIFIESSARLNTAANLAKDPYIIQSLSPYQEDGANQLFAPVNDSALQQWLNRYRAIDTSNPSGIALYDADGRMHLNVGPAAIPGILELDDPDAKSVPTFNSFEFDGQEVISSLVVAPVFSPSTQEQIGYVAIKAEINPLLEYAMGTPRFQRINTEHENTYQILYLAGDQVFTVQGVLGRDPDDSTALRIIPTHPKIEEYLKDRPLFGTHSIPKYIYENGKPAYNAMVAYQSLVELKFTNLEIYLLVYRPSANVFSSINRSVILLTIGCILFIGILSINAYREVHNNIVRPVSLLNEGAQIVRQGDFDLKLKIDTGDEIEELAMSFNKMAIALKSNIVQLEDSEEKYRHLVTSLRDGIYQIDMEGNFSFLNKAGLLIFGFSNLEQAMGTPIRRFFTEDVDFDPMSSVVQLAESGDRVRLWLERIDGEVICVELTRNRVFDEDNHPTGLEGIIRDITKGVQLEDEARERSERISAINQIANVINSSLEAGRLYESLVGELKKLLDFDYAAVALLSESGECFDGRQLWPEQEVLPGYTFSLNIEDSCAAWVVREQECLVVDKLQSETSPFASQFPAGTKSCLCVPLYATGRIIGTLNLGSELPRTFLRHDVEAIEQMAPHLAVAIRNAQLLTNLQLSLEEVTRAREKLHEVNDELKSLDEMKTNLLSNVSHELRTPLVSVMGYNDMILNGKAGPINNVQQDYLEISLRNIEKLVTLIENLLDFSRLNRGDERLIFATFDLRDCARGSIQIVQPMADSRKIKIDLIAQDEPIWIDGDKGKMGQVFNNLLSNAIKFNEPGGTISVELHMMMRSVEVVVTDTGIGIPEDALDKIFTRFYQYDGSSTRKYGGTGIGLAIAQDIVRLHGNTITATSTPGEGTTFRFTLSLSPTHTGEHVEPPEPVPESSHILVEVVTLDKALSMQIRDLLTAEGMDMIHAGTADSAAALVQRHHPDCILVDLSPVDAFRDFILSIDADTGELSPPIVVLTNDTDDYLAIKDHVSAQVKRNFRKSGLLSGIHHAITKEFDAGIITGHKVLCVDDDPEILAFVDRCLVNEGYETALCGSGEEALKVIKQGDFGLVLLDISMPGMDGWETCLRIKSDPDLAGVKVYMVTAKPITQDTLAMKESGADGLLLKPFRSDDLLQLLQSLELQIQPQ